MSEMEAAARSARGARADAFLKEFFDPAFDVVRAEYVNRIAELAAAPVNGHSHDNIVKVALAVKVLDQVRAQVASLVTDGQVAEHEMRRTRQIEAISPERRKILGI